MQKIETEEQAIARFRETYPKVKIQDRAEWTPGWINNKAVVGYTIYRLNGQEGWVVDENGIIWEASSFQKADSGQKPPTTGSRLPRSHD